jgi:hypothetical protein
VISNLKTKRKQRKPTKEQHGTMKNVDDDEKEMKTSVPID